MLQKITDLLAALASIPAAVTTAQTSLQTFSDFLDNV